MNIELIKKEITEAFVGLNFDEDTHTYTWNGNRLISTTSYIERFSEEFNSYFASEAKANKNLRVNVHDKRNSTYYRNRWKYIRDEASIAGNRVHAFADCYPDFDLPMCSKEQGVLDFYKNLNEKYIVLFTEFRVYDKNTLRAGTMDGLLYNTETNKLVIIDWKTNNRNINECYKSKKLKDPFSSLFDTSLNKYAIQLSDYANIIQKNTNFEVEERWVIWLYNGDVDSLDSDRSTDYKIIKINPSVNAKNYKIYKCQDYSVDIETKLQDDKTKTELKSAKPKKGLFTKKVAKKDSLATLLKKTKNNK